MHDDSPYALQTSVSLPARDITFREWNLETYLMPLVRFGWAGPLLHWQIFGFEALVRSAPDFPSPGTLFRRARTMRLEQALEMWCVVHALKLLQQLPGRTSLFINVSTDALLSRELEHHLASVSLFNDPQRVVFEILPGGIAEAGQLRELIKDFSQLGYRFAIDDLGAMGSHVKRMAEVGPVDYLKIDRSFLSQTWAKAPDLAKEWLAAVCTRARAEGQDVVLEGVEESCMGILPEIHGLGIRHGQGFLFGCPAPSKAWADRPTHACYC